MALTAAADLRVLLEDQVTLSPLLSLPAASPMVGPVAGLVIVTCLAVTTVDMPVALTPTAGVNALVTTHTRLCTVRITVITLSPVDCHISNMRILSLVHRAPFWWLL